MSDARAALRERILRAIAAGTSADLGDGRFNDLALAVFRHQFSRNPPYRAYCESRGTSPDDVDSWEQVPAVPTDAFKAAALVCGDPSAARAVFRTSGTTAGPERRGTHYFLDLSLYEAALREGFRAALVPEGRIRILSLIPSAPDQPDSSLSHMASTVVEAFGDSGSVWLVDPRTGLDVGGTLMALRAAERAAEPVLLLGTSLAFVHLFDEMRRRGERVRLASGSRAMDTGGFKGRSREVGREELIQAFGAILGIPPDRVVNEYGMTEMSSQFYASGGEPHRRPAWVRSRAYDPETLEPLGAGETGVLRHWDLANLDSVMVLQTADLGRVRDDSLELIGRARGAEARGCSLAMDELLTALRRG